MHVRGCEFSAVCFPTASEWMNLLCTTHSDTVYDFVQARASMCG